MPDWFYRTVAQRALFGLPDRAARGVALGVIGTLGRSAAGRALIDFMGHMAPDERLAVQVAGVRFGSPVGLGWRVDPEGRATAGLACFGAGCLEVQCGLGRGVRRSDGESLSDTKSDGGAASRPMANVPLLERQADAAGIERVRLPTRVELPVVGWDQPTENNFDQGVVLQVGTRNDTGGWTVPAKMPGTLPEKVRAWRRALPVNATLIVAGGVDRPADVVALVEAGANLVLIEAGLVYRGPGLVKRCNEALLARLPGGTHRLSPLSQFRRAWFWTVALGVAMATGGVAALVLALSRVLLPYDEQYLGMSARTLRQTMPQLFAFMAHDRATLAGVMLGIGWLYVCLGWFGVRAGRHGAKTAVVASALVGFASFFAFFGFGYFDTLHAFVAVVLFQFAVQIMVSEDGGASEPILPADEEDADWRRAQWGQLFFVVHAAGLLFAGCLILGIGMTRVFVSEDLGFLCMTPQQAQELGEHMIGVIAHDRASLGGMLLACGVAMLLPVLWCFRRGETWLWWAIAGLGGTAYLAALGVHLKVGYTDWRHMLPAVAGLLLWLGGLVLSRSYLRSGCLVTAKQPNDTK